MPTLALNDDLVLPVPQALAWKTLHDLTLLADSLPEGARCQTGDAPGAFLVALPGFEGRVLQLDLDAPSRLRLSFEGRGPRTGAVTGQAQLRLASLGDDRALLHVALVIQAEGATPSKVAGLQALRARLVAFAAAVERRHPSDRPLPVKAPPNRGRSDWSTGTSAGSRRSSTGRCIRHPSRARAGRARGAERVHGATAGHPVGERAGVTRPSQDLCADVTC
ncbi:CoxG family protein [Roseateles chitinivorans]|uniref:CoxG family protein n=1 Tax=Roseateles chitinivorans TaxID=2917965 RepID=UPI003D667360